MEKAQNDQKERCAFCGISSVPLFLCLDGKKRCVDHASMILSSKQEEKKDGSRKK